jgi:hypothetical protein
LSLFLEQALEKNSASKSKNSKKSKKQREESGFSWNFFGLFDVAVRISSIPPASQEFDSQAGFIP